MTHVAGARWITSFSICACVMATSISVRLDIAARNAYTLRDPVANLGLEPANRARTQWDGSRERTILDLLVHGAACKSRARLNLLASKDRILNCIAHVDHLAVKNDCVASVPLRCGGTAVGAPSFCSRSAAITALDKLP